MYVEDQIKAVRSEMAELKKEVIELKNQLAARVYTITEASTELGISRQTLTRWAKEGLISFTMVGKRMMFTNNQINKIKN